VTTSQVRWLRSELGTAGLKREVGALRCGLDTTAWDGEGAVRCAGLLQLPPGTAPREGEPLPFDAARAHALYAALLGEARELINGKHLLVVPSGALTTLPFQVLVTEAPASPDLAKARWLVRDHAVTVLPSAASLLSLRRTGRPSAAAKAMLGFANPLLDGNQNDPEDGAWYKEQAERARAETGCATTRKHRTAARRAIGRSARPVPQVAGLANLAHLKVQTPLPETANEVCEVARALGADVSEMRIGARATETEIKRLSAAGELARYRILHFATHGVLAGQLSGTREPGLILTPPATATPEDDGYLSGSDIAGLKLDADWVILSACNTAGGAGRGEAAEALSGLARVFFYAGARALLVSHWEGQRRRREAGHKGGRCDGQGQGPRPRRGVAPRHALGDGRHVPAVRLDARVAPLRVGAVRGCRRGRGGGTLTAPPHPVGAGSLTALIGRATCSTPEVR
jgi:CHAT domain-containing protein